MDITPQDNTATQPISDDQELAKALAGVLPDEEPNLSDGGESTDDMNTTPSLQFEETPVALPTAPAEPSDAPAVTAAAIASTPATPAPATFTMPTPSAAPAAVSPAVTGLDDIKNSALQELRPLIDRVDLPAEEKFDTYLMLIRSTDDATLIAPAHAVAQNITDEKRKAEALLDIIKEIDYLSRKDQQPAA